MSDSMEWVDQMRKLDLIVSLVAKMHARLVNAYDDDIDFLGAKEKELMNWMLEQNLEQNDEKIRH